MTVYPRCNECLEPVHPIFDWCDHEQQYLCDDCLDAVHPIAD
ncbi:hypothetical protein [Gordonia phage Lizzo]|nr:hypothetical protein [Gordonia phage Lizzo]